MTYTNEIPQRAFINAQIIQEVQRTGNWAAAVRSICTLYELQNYEYSNQAHIASLLYCLLVIPKEIWIKKNKAHTVFNAINKKLLRDSFKIVTIKDQDFESNFTYNLLHKLRNSVAHANFNVDEQMNFTFWNESNRGETFRAIVTRDNLMLFISHVGSALANLRAKT
jgi:hypothetical protein